MNQAPPPGFRMLRASRHAGTCSSCGRRLAAGSSIWWSPTTKAIRCLPSCEAAASVPPFDATPGVSAGPVAFAELAPDDRWRRLIAYLKRCVALEAANGLVDVQSKNWTTIRTTAESLINGGASSIPVDVRLQELASQLQPGEVLQYGWPTIVIVDANGVRLAPLLVTELEAPEPGDTELSRTDDVHLNPSVLGVDAFDPSDIDEMVSLFDDGIPTGDPVVLAALLDAAAEALGLTSPGLNHATLQFTVPDETGLHNIAVVVKADSANMTRTLLQELGDLELRADWQETAAAALLDHQWSASQNGPADLRLIAPLPLNDSQETIARRTAASLLTVVTGPPGTGKSQLVVAAIANSWVRGETTLLVSTNNAAVDVAVDRCADVDPAMLIRTGNQTFRHTVPAQVTHAVKAAAHTTHDEAVVRRDLATVSDRRKQLLSSIEELGNLERSMSQLLLDIEQHRDLLWAPKRQPLDLRPEDVLRRARRARRAWFFRRRRCRELLRSVGTTQAGADVETLARWAELGLQRGAAALKLSELSASLRDMEDQLRTVDSEWQEVSRRAIHSRISARVQTGKNKLAALTTAPGGGPAFAHSVAQALPHLQGWACTALTLKSNFPLKPALFDHVIVDEASQCKLAEILPAAYRARRLTVLGDPQQLHPIVKVDRKLAANVAVATGLDPRDLERRRLDHPSGSAYAAFAEVVGPDDVQFLDEHFRCHPLIARWFNATFYGGELSVLTDVGQWPPGRRGLEWVDVEGAAHRPKNSSTINEIEARAVVDRLADFIEDEVTVGVVTPFAGQGNEIWRLARQRFGEEALGQVDFVSSTAHRLQGNERDVILFSTVIAPGVRPRTAKWVESQRNLVNVAVSRARRAVIVFGHPTEAAAHRILTLSSLREVAVDGPIPEDAHWTVHSEAERRLRDALHRLELAPTLKQFEEGYELDFAFTAPIRLNVEVDGDHHNDARGRQRRQDLARDRVLRGLGWDVVRYPDWRCLADADEVATEILERLLLPDHGESSVHKQPGGS